MFSRHASGYVLALAGGGGRGLAHLGALKALEENELRPDAIVGTSIGALFGAMYALNPNADEVRERVFSFLESDTFHNLSLPSVHDADAGAVDQSWLARLTTVAQQTILYTRAMTDIAVADNAALAQVAGVFCAQGSFEDAKIPFYATAVHFPGGECSVFSQGDLCQVLAASMAIPGVFDPVVI
ncbi:MAG: patatin-like phospholipase family protein, partial [Mariprofundaceae bacterium]|nr:patatin-like phospholipase family protein [Mariprofundaceae bacterium]